MLHETFAAPSTRSLLRGAARPTPVAWSPVAPAGGCVGPAGETKRSSPAASDVDLCRQSETCRRIPRRGRAVTSRRCRGPSTLDAGLRSTAGRGARSPPREIHRRHGRAATQGGGGVASAHPPDSLRRCVIRVGTWALFTIRDGSLPHEDPQLPSATRLPPTEAGAERVGSRGSRVPRPFLFPLERSDPPLP